MFVFVVSSTSKCVVSFCEFNVCGVSASGAPVTAVNRGLSRQPSLTVTPDETPASMGVEASAQ